MISSTRTCIGSIEPILLLLVAGLLAPALAAGQDRDDWSDGVEPILVFGGECGTYGGGGDHAFQMFRWAEHPTPDTIQYFHCLFDVGDPLAPEIVWQGSPGPTSTEMPSIYDDFLGSYGNLVLIGQMTGDGWLSYLRVFDPRDDAVEATLYDPLFHPSFRRDNILWTIDDNGIDTPDLLVSRDLEAWPAMPAIASLELPSVITNPNDAVKIGAGGAFCIHVADKTASPDPADAADSSSGGPARDEIVFLDLDDPAAPRVGGSIEIDGLGVSSAYACHPTADVLYISPPQQLCAIDYSDVMNPVQTDLLSCGAYLVQVMLHGDLGLLFFDEGDFQVVSLADPAVVAPLSGLVHEPKGSGRYTAAFADEFLYLGCGSQGVALYDLSDPSAPAFVGRAAGDIGQLNIVDGHLVANGMVFPLHDPGPSPVADRDVPAPVRLLGAAPNPFNPRTTVSFSLDRARAIDLGVYDLRGLRLKTLARATWPAGVSAVAWDGADEQGRAMPSGVYLLRLEAGDFRANCRIVLAR